MIHKILFFFKKTYRKLKYKYKRITVKIDRPNFDNLTPNQKKVVKIISKLLLDPNVKLYTNPLDSKFYLKKFEGEVVTMFVIIESKERGFNISITGKTLKKDSQIIEKFHYDIWLPSDGAKIVMNKFYKVLKRMRNKMEDEILKENENNITDLMNGLN
jgi:hypothetical protein